MCDRFEDESTAAAVERIPGTVFTLGDNVYPDGSAKSFKDCYEPSWGRPTIKSRTRPTVGGNEYRVPDARDYFAYFGDAAGDPGKGYYAYEEGSWRVYVLNSNCHQIGGCGEGSAQEVWLRDDLKRHSSRCVLAMWHHPLFSSRPGGGIGLTRALWRALEDAGAELVLNGDVHSYERFRPQTADGVADDERGMVEIVVGTGGAESGSFGPPADNSVRRAVSVYGVLRLELARSSYRFEFLSTGGRDFSDSGSRRCS
jgi:alkaline phosphatase